MFTWLKANKLSLNVNKTYHLIFHRARIKVDNDNSIRMNENIINSASHLKYLGVIIDSIDRWLCGVGLELHHCLYPGMS